MTRYVRATSVAEALAAIAEGGCDIIAGATDVFPARATAAAEGRVPKRGLIDVSGLTELKGITDEGTHWRMGALTTWRDVIAAPVPPLFDGLKAAAREIGGVQIQTRGTIGGNICTASPAGDSIPCLMALDAEVEMATAGDHRVRVPIGEFLTGYRATQAQTHGALVTAVLLPKRAGSGHFLKLGARRYLVISIAMVSGVFERDAEGRIVHAAIAIGACSPVAQRLGALEQALVGNLPDPQIVEPAHLAGLNPLDDVRASAAYRMSAALTLVRDLLAEADRTRRIAA
jgi:N-methylhydantoinase B